MGTTRTPTLRARGASSQSASIPPARTRSCAAMGARSRSVDRSLTDAQRSRLVSSECTQLVELRVLGATGSSAEGALGGGPEPDEHADFRSSVIPGRRAFRPKGLFVVDGGSQCTEGPSYALGSVTSCWEAGVLLRGRCSSARRTRPWRSLALFWCSLSVPFGDPAQQERPSPFLVRASGLREYLVGVTGFEPAASSSRTGDHSALPCR